MVAEAAGLGIMIFVLALIAFVVLLAIASIVLLIWAIVDIAKAKNDSDWKALWILICILGGLIGVIVYFVVGRKDKK